MAKPLFGGLRGLDEQLIADVALVRSFAQFFSADYPLGELIAQFTMGMKAEPDDKADIQVFHSGTLTQPVHCFNAESMNQGHSSRSNRPRGSRFSNHAS